MTKTSQSGKVDPGPQLAFASVDQLWCELKMRATGLVVIGDFQARDVDGYRPGDPGVLTQILYRGTNAHISGLLAHLNAELIPMVRPRVVHPGPHVQPPDEESEDLEQ